MAPSRGRGRPKAPIASSRNAPTRRAPLRSGRKAKDASPDVYGDMVAAAVASDPVELSDRPLKRRKVSRKANADAVAVDPPEAPNSSKRQSTARANNVANESPAKSSYDGRSWQLQTVEASSDSEESDLGFEDVDLAPKAADSSAADDTGDEIGDVSVSVASKTQQKTSAVNRRKPGTGAEKASRLLVHKAHFLTLLGHCMYANSRCNNATAQKHMRRLLDKRMISYLNPKVSDSQFQRNRSFLDGLEQARLAFKANFDVTATGMSRARWNAERDDEIGQVDADPQDLEAFIDAASTLQGSQDTGNQLFCSMLRAAGVEARLVCSLQTLPYASAPKAPTPKKPKKPAVFAIASDTDPDVSDASLSDGNVGSSSTIGKVPSVRRRLGQPSLKAQPAAKLPPKPKQKSVRTLSYPVFWVEAFNAAHQKWVPVDAAVTDSVNKPTKIEPPASYDLNQLAYAIAFEADGVARDVTRRYAKAFNAKTRRQRVEGSGEDGTKWLKRALRLFRRRGQKLDRDQVEDAELAQKEAREGLPANVLDFKEHPYYALERHLRRHEVLHPRREVGKVNAGTAAKPRMEAVFRRQDVLSCKSADKWYRLGREIKPGEQPLKHVTARRRQVPDDDEGDAAQHTALYAPNQTELYIPPPVKAGRIPKNQYGNLDVYVPSMVPPGAVHIRHSLTQQAAQILKIDYADAVTGFKFQGRHGTAIVEGAVVAEEFGEAVRATIDGFEQQILEDESKARSLTALRLWSRFLKGLRIAERVAAYGNGEQSDNKNAEEKAQEEEDDDGVNSVAPPEAVDASMPSAGKYSIADLTRKTPTKKGKKKAIESDEDSDHYTPTSSRADRRGRAIIDDDDSEAEYMPDYAADNGGGGFVAEDAEPTDTGGGFVPEALNADQDIGGGFVVEEEDGEDGHASGSVPDRPAADDVAGGFLVEDDGDGNMGGDFVHEPPNNMNQSPSSPRGERGPLMDVDIGGGFIVEESEPNAGGVSPDHGEHLHSLPAGDHMHAESTTEIKASHPRRPVIHDAHEAAATQVESHGSALEPYPEVDEELADGRKDLKENDSDRESLLSHDPEDDDAEPDWLESD